MNRRSDHDPVGDRPAPAAPARLPELDDFPETGANALGSFGQRAVARVLDEVIINIPLVALLFVLIAAQFGTIDASATDAFVTPLWYIGVSVVVSALYEIVAVALWGRTLGKLALGLRVARWTDGGRPTWSQATLRCLLPLTAGAATLMISSYSWGAIVILCSAFFDDLRRGWHDKAGGTIVVRTR